MVGRSCTARLVWSLVFLSCLGMFSYQMYWVVEKYLRNEKIVNIELAFEKVPFPAVTMCNVNPYKSSLLYTIGDLAKTMGAFENAMGGAKRSNRRQKLPTRAVRQAPGHPSPTPSDHHTNPTAHKPPMNKSEAEADPAFRKQGKESADSTDPKTLQKQEEERSTSSGWTSGEGGERRRGTPTPPSPARAPEVLRKPRRPRNPQFKAAVGHCDCAKGKADACDLVRPPTQPPGNESTCICNYDRLQEDAWPCYSLDTWERSLCTQCSHNGYCVPPKFTEEAGGEELGCICQTISNYCIQLLDEGDGLVKLWEVMTTSTTTTTELPPSTTEDPGFAEAMGFGNMTDEVALVTKAKENLVFSMAALPIQTRVALSYAKDEFVWKCSFNGQQCDITKDFKLHVDPFYGNCYTFNHDQMEPKRTTRAGPTYGLRVFLYINSSDFMATTESKGVRIAVHNQTEMPFPDVFGFSAPTGFVSSFGIKLKQVMRLPAPYGDCITKEAQKEELSIYKGYDYSPEGCYRSCFQECIERYRENAAMVEIFFEQLNYEQLIESEAYGLVNLLADFGGQLGLWMGISVITCAEFFVLVWDLFRFICLRLKKAPEKRAPTKTDELRMAEEAMELNKPVKEQPPPSFAAYSTKEDFDAI